MNRTQAVCIILFSAITLIIVSCGDDPTTPAPTQPPDTADTLDTRQYFAFFPPFSAGDTLSWDYTYDKGYWADHKNVDGVMSWEVTSTTITEQDTVAQILQTFKGTCLRWYSVSIPETLKVQSDTTFVTIRRDSRGWITFSSSAPAGHWWYFNLNYSFPQYDSTSSSQLPSLRVLLTFGGGPIMVTASATHQSGLVMIQYTNGMMSALENVRYVRRL